MMMYGCFILLPNVDEPFVLISNHGCLSNAQTMIELCPDKFYSLNSTLRFERMAMKDV